MPVAVNHVPQSTVAAVFGKLLIALSWSMATTSIATPLDITQALHAPCEASIGTDGQFRSTKIFPHEVFTDRPRVATRVARCDAKDGVRKVKTALPINANGDAYIKSLAVLLEETITCKNKQRHGPYKAMLQESGWPRLNGRAPEWNVTANFKNNKLDGEVVVRTGRAAGNLCRSLQMKNGELNGETKLLLGRPDRPTILNFRQGVIEQVSFSGSSGQIQEIKIYKNGKIAFTDLYIGNGNSYRRYRRNEHKSDFEWSHVVFYDESGRVHERLTMKQYSERMSPGSSQRLKLVGAISTKYGLLVHENPAKDRDADVARLGGMLHVGLMPCSDGICVGPFTSLGYETSPNGAAHATTVDVSGLIFGWFAYIHAGVGYRQETYLGEATDGWQATFGGGFAFFGAFIRHARMPGSSSSRTEMAATLNAPLLF